jgi:hypothetical protein
MSVLRVLVACESSGIVRDAFLAAGHDAWSCDLLPSARPSNRHIQDDVRRHLRAGWDLLMIAHPPCTRLCNSGVRWLTDPPTQLNPAHHTPEECAAYLLMDWQQRLDFMWEAMRRGADFFNELWNAPIERVCAENPVMHKHARERIVNWVKPQIVQPWHHGDPFFKATGLYLRNLDLLHETNRLTPPRPGTAEHKAWSKVHMAPPGPDRWRIRSEFFPGIAAAMADQWGGLPAAPYRMAA